MAGEAVRAVDLELLLQRDDEGPGGRGDSGSRLVQVGGRAAVAAAAAVFLSVVVLLSCRSPPWSRHRGAAGRPGELELGPSRLFLSSFQYVGCFANIGAERVEGHLVDFSLAACGASAGELSRRYFGMEYPEGAVAEGMAGCLTLDAVPRMRKAPDAECEGMGLFEGYRLGSAFRLALYALPRLANASAELGLWATVTPRSKSIYRVLRHPHVGAKTMSDRPFVFTSLGGFEPADRLTCIQVADNDSDTLSSEVQFTLEVRRAVRVFLVYRGTAPSAHAVERPWIEQEGWGLAENLFLPDWDGPEALVEVRWKAFPAGHIAIRGHNGGKVRGGGGAGGGPLVLLAAEWRTGSGIGFDVGALVWQGDGDRCLDLDVSGGAPTGGTKLQVRACDRLREGMRFIFPKDRGLIRWAPQPELCVHPSAANAATGTPLVLWPCREDWESMHWVMCRGSGPLRLVYDTQKCMLADEARDGAEVRLGDCPTHGPILMERVWEPRVEAYAPRLYCWSCLQQAVALVHAETLAMQHSLGLGIFGCEGHAVFTATGGPFGGVPTIGLGKDETHDCDWGAAVYTCNTRFFVKAWEQLVALEAYSGHDWVVKVDAGAAFFPARLRRHLAKWGGGSLAFIEDNAALPEMLGQLEVVSAPAVERFARQRQRCYDALDDAQTREDGYFSDCFARVLRARALVDLGLLQATSNPEACAGEAACFRGLGAQSGVRLCYEAALR